ncbi:hemerythrin domain-containing protein [Nocardia yunnanensis]|uniref:Hemerythrin domain-containing protein n=1 Tax=Nocardia yunnanensis TaxID=2382165 RepID=A0A386ZPB0_9NOCA|nr:hemerythrin domain-containing protein [Nocardia yunnanensis]AYF78529.1 hemerythrin domain-containing protein [Nocardia yunnanensis]
MDALTFLRGDHESVLGILESLERGGGWGGRQQGAYADLVTSLIIAESQHEAIEEQYFWPEVRRSVPGGDKLADLAIEQEDSAKKLLDQLEHQSAGTDLYDALLAQIIPAARAHIAFEQNEVWPQLAASVPPEVLEELGDKMAKAKKLAPTRPHPQTPSTPGALKTTGMFAAVVDRIRDAATGRARHKPPTPPAP